MKAQSRVNRIVGHLGGASPSQLTANPTSGKSDDDVVIVSALRTAIGRARKGSFKDTHPSDLLTAVFKGVLNQTGIDAAKIDDVIVGNVLAPGGFAINARMAALHAGIPSGTSLSTCNRQCSSGLQAVAHIAGAIKSGFIDIGLAGGVESMSLTPMGMAALGSLSQDTMETKEARDCLIPMGVTSENVASKFGVTREDQDRMAVESHARALRAQAEGRFKDEIVPVTTIIKDKEDNEKTITVTQDDGPRKGSTMERLAKLRTVFKKTNGTTTAANSSQVSDGAAAVLLMRRSKARELGLPVIGKFVTFAVKGCPPAIMGIGPAVAIPEALSKAGLTKDQVDIYEINEAFASQATYCVKKLGLDMSKVNPNGGAIALGHPLGCTGARMVATLLGELKRTGQKTGVVSMCIGSGMGAAAVFERE